MTALAIRGKALKGDVLQVKLFTESKASLSEEAGVWFRPTDTNSEIIHKLQLLVIAAQAAIEAADAD